MSKTLHVISVLVGYFGIATIIAAVVAGTSSIVLGFSREHLLFCSIIVFLIAIRLQIAAIHHMMLEKK